MAIFDNLNTSTPISLPDFIPKLRIEEPTKNTYGSRYLLRQENIGAERKSALSKGVSVSKGPTYHCNQETGIIWSPETLNLDNYAMKMLSGSDLEISGVYSRSQMLQVPWKSAVSSTMLLITIDARFTIPGNSPPTLLRCV